MERQDMMILPPPVEFEDRVPEIWSSSSLLSSCEDESRCIWEVRTQECKVNTPTAAHLTPIEPETQEFSLSGPIQQISHLQKSSPRDEKLHEIERKFEMFLQESMSSYLKENFSTPTYFEQSN